MVDRSKQMKGGLEYVMQKYLNPLRKLTADLPNHAIEMQIEIHDSIPSESAQNPQRRVIRVMNARHPKIVKRSQDLAAAAAADAAASTTTTAASDPAQAGETPAIVSLTTASGPTDPSKMPVYMEDLKKALDELERKLNTTPENTTTMTTCGDAPCNGGTSQIKTPVRNIDDIVQILKKAIHVEHRMPKPSDDLEWVQVKIPKIIK